MSKIWKASAASIGTTLSNETDQLPYEQETAAKITKKVRLESNPSKESVYQNGHLKTAFSHYIKALVLFLIWCIYSICIITSEEDFAQKHLITIPADNEKFYAISVKTKLKQTIQLCVKGPFAMEQNLKALTDPTTAQLEMYVNLKSATENKPITHKFAYIVMEPKRLEYIVSVEQCKLLQLLENLSERHVGSFSLELSLKTIKVDRITTIKLWFHLNPIDKTTGIILGIALLIFLYIMIIWEFINRTLASVIASTLAIGVLGALGCKPAISKIIKWIDVETLMLLFSMMVLVIILSESGIFDYSAVLAYELAKGDIFKLIYVLCIFTAVISAFFDNVTMMLLATPVTIRLCEITNMNPVPVILCMIMFANIGAALTPVGDPPNIIITTNRYIVDNGIHFGAFTLHMLPGVIIGMLCTFLLLRLKYRTVADFMNRDTIEVEALRHEIQVWEKAAHGIVPTTTDEEIVQNTLYKKAHILKKKLAELQLNGAAANVDFKETLSHMKTAYPIRNKMLLIKSSMAFGFVLLLFFSHSFPNLHYLSLGWSALLGAIGLLILADDQDIESVLAKVEWSTLLFFACLFILMEALTELGLIGLLGELCADVIKNVPHDYRLLVSILLILWVSGVASAFLDNIPVTTMMIKIVVNLAENKELQLPLAPLVWSLAFGACFGGNGTLIAASANVVASGLAEQHGYRIGFVEFFRIGFPITINTLVWTSVYLTLAHCVWHWH